MCDCISLLSQKLLCHVGWWFLTFLVFKLIININISSTILTLISFSFNLTQVVPSWGTLSETAPLLHILFWLHILAFFALPQPNLLSCIWCLQPIAQKLPLEMGEFQKILKWTRLSWIKTHLKSAKLRWCSQGNGKLFKSNSLYQTEEICQIEAQGIPMPTGLEKSSKQWWSYLE